MSERSIFQGAKNVFKKKLTLLNKHSDMSINAEFYSGFCGVGKALVLIPSGKTDCFPGGGGTD